MKIITIYHGSEAIIKAPIYGYGNIHNDYGSGFYCTEQYSMAGEWACKGGKNGYINKYSLDLSDLRILNLLDKQFNVLNWMALLLENRTFRIASPIGNEAKKYILNNFLVDISGYDVIKGYRADDSYFSFAQAFIENTLSLQALNKALYLGKLGEQIVLRSQKAYKYLDFMGNDIAKEELYHPMFVMRDGLARKQYREEVANLTDIKRDLFIMDVMRAGLTNDDIRL